MQHLYLFDHFINIIFLSFLFFLFYFSYRKYVKRRLSITKQEWINDNVFKYFDYYRIKNIYYSSFKAFIYMILNILVFFILRLLNLNRYVDITSINPLGALNIVSIIYILLIILTLFYYIKFIKEWLFPDIIRLYLYFYSEENFFTDLINSLYGKRFFFTRMISNIHLLLRYCLYQGDRELADRLARIVQGSDLFKFRRFFYSKVKDYHNLLYFIKLLDDYIFSKLVKYTLYVNGILKESVLVILVIVLLYDLTHKQLFYIYYALVIFTIINLYCRLMKFISNIELGDISLGKYFYKGFYKKPITPEEFTKIEEKANRDEKLTEEEINSARMRAKMIEHIPYVEDWTDYLLNDLKNIYVRRNGWDCNEYPYIIWPIRRVILMISSMLCLIYILYYRKITILLGGFVLNNHVIFLATIYVLSKLWYITGYIYLKKLPYDRPMKGRTYGKHRNHKLFLILNVGIILFTIIIFLHINFFSLMQDQMNFYNMIKINVSYTIEEKISFMQYYLQQLYPVIIRHTTLFAPKTLSLDYLLNIVSQLDYQELISKNTSVAVMKEYCEGLLGAYFTQEKYLEDLLQKLYMQDIHENSVSYQMKNFIGVLLATLSMGYTVQYYNNLYHLIFQIGTTTFTRKILHHIYINAVNICKGDKKKAWILIKYVIEYLAHGKKK